MFNQAVCPCLNHGIHTSNSRSMAHSTHLTKGHSGVKTDPYKHGSRPCPSHEQSPAGDTVPPQEDSKELHCPPLPVPLTGFKVYKAGVRGRLPAPACTAPTKLIPAHHSQVWALSRSRTRWQGNLWSLSHAVPVPHATWVHEGGDGPAARTPLPHSQHHPTDLSQAGLNISIVQNWLWSDKMFPRRHDNRNELSRWSWLVLLVLTLRIFLGTRKHLVELNEI